MALVFGTIMTWIALFLTLDAVQNRLIWLLVFPILAWPIVAMKSEKAGGLMAFGYALLFTLLYFAGFFRTGPSIINLLQFILALPVPAVLIGLLLFHSASKEREGDAEKWKAIASKTATSEQSPENTSQNMGIGQWMQKRQ